MLIFLLQIPVSLHAAFIVGLLELKPLCWMMKSGTAKNLGWKCNFEKICLEIFME